MTAQPKGAMMRKLNIVLVLAVIALAVAILSFPALLHHVGLVPHPDWFERAAAAYGDPPPWAYTQCTALAPQPCEPWDGVDRTHPGYLRAAEALEAERAGW